MSLDNTTQRALLELLSPLLEREEDRRALLTLVFGEHAPVLKQLELHGTVEAFVLQLTAEMVRLGQAEPGQQALGRLLRTLRGRAPAAQQARIDALERIVNRPAVQASAAATQHGRSPVLHLRLFLSSPGDVADERALARQVFDRLSYDPLLRGQLMLEVVAWDQAGAGVPMLANLSPQEAIAAGLPKPSECDIVVVIFWSRMGTPLSDEYRKPDGTRYNSGTEWEYFEALQAAQGRDKPVILVYHRTQKYLVDADEPDAAAKLQQREHVRAFFASFRNPDGSPRQGYNPYATPEDFRQQLEFHVKAIIRPWLDRLSQLETAPAPEPAPPSLPLWEGSPFPGLRAFTPDDAPIFFGRGRETDELVHRLADSSTRILVVVGASGSGKSSLIAAGLLPRLMDNAIEGSKDWRLPSVSPSPNKERKQWAGLRFTPGELGDNPLLALAVWLLPLLPDYAMTAGKVAEQLEADPALLVQFAEAALQGRPAWSELLMFVDQFEELFSVVAERYRGPFIDMLVAAARAPRVRIVATMRAEFSHLCLEWPKLAAILGTAFFPLAAPRVSALFDMINGPAARAGLTFEERLAARILDDTGTDSGALALLAFTLNELYETRTPDGLLTQSAYEAFGGVRGAIGRRAEATFKNLPGIPEEALRSMCRELIDVDERGVVTRQRVARERLESFDASKRLVEAFTEARLLIIDEGPQGRAMVEVAHEALVREWPRLKDWVSAVSEDLRRWRQVQTAAADWERSGYAASHRWPDARLRQVDATLQRLAIRRDTLPEPVRSFVHPEAERLMEELQRPDTTEARRAEIEDRVIQIGDLRPGVGLRPDGLPDIAWCEVTGGTVVLEGGGGSCRVERFFIAKYPVTYRQYRVFLDHPTGYIDDRWWKGLEHKPDPGKQYWRVASGPAENVSWYDAIAYCRWLSAQLGFEVRLPVETEWQQAANAGHIDRAYPWGSDWREGCANTCEGGLRRTTVVGLYPRGASAQGISDLAGNVWEWCLNRYDKPSEISLVGTRDRSVRGGSWAGNKDFTLCTGRARCSPEGRYHIIGFRLAGAPTLSEARIAQEP